MSDVLPSNITVPPVGSSSRTNGRPSVEFAGTGFADDAGDRVFGQVEVEALRI